MTLGGFCDIISQLNIPAIYGAFHGSEKTPYISYSAVERNVIHADGVVVYGEDWIELRLVTRYRDIALEQEVEALLTENGIAFGYPDYELNEEQRIHTVYYSFMLDPFSEDRVPHITLKELNAAAAVEATAQLHIESIYPSDAEITWLSSDASIATVDASGTVTGVSDGTCSVIAMMVTGGITYADACTITIEEEENT